MTVPISGDFQDFLRRLASPPLRAIAQHWDRARGDRQMPTWADLSTSELSPHFTMIWGFQYDSQMRDFVGRLAGKHVRDWLGANFWGASLRDLHPPHVFGPAYEFLSSVVSIPAAGRCSGQLFTIGGEPVQGERIALPLAADGATGDAILGASDYEEFHFVGQVELIHEKMECFSL